MKTNEILKNLRLEKNWSQKDVAEKLKISVNGYSKIERGKSSISTERLMELAQIFGINPQDLLPQNESGTAYLIISGDNNQGSNFYNTTQDTSHEIEKLKLTLQYKDQLLHQQARELAHIQELLKLLQHK